MGQPKKQNKNLSSKGVSKSASKDTSKENFFEVKIWGARGSLPAPPTPAVLQKQIRELLCEYVKLEGGKKLNEESLDRFLLSKPRAQFGGYGGNTPCVEVRCQSQQIIIDGGSGIRPLGYEMMAGLCGKGAGEVHILFTHFHWDHLIGLPFFTPIFIPGNKIHVYAVQRDLKDVFQTLFKKPYFPVPLEKLGAQIEYHYLEPRKPIQLAGFKVTPYELDHPDPCWGFKVERFGKAYAHCVDTEGKRLTREELGPDLPLYQDIDTMIFDAQYTLLESIERVNWGHASASLGLDIAMREAVRRVIFMHHDPASIDIKVAAAEAQAREYYEHQLRHAQENLPPLHPVDWEFGYEGMVLRV